MKRKAMTVGPLFVACSLYLLLAFSLARRFPPVNTDEIVRADIGLQVIHGRPSRYSLFDDIFARPVYALRDVLPETSLAIYHVWLGAWTSLRPSSYMSARGSSMAAGVLALLMFYGLGKRLGGTDMALWCVVLAAFNPLFLTASSIARPETLLVFATTAVLWLMLELPEQMGLKPFLIGCLGMAQMSIHPNASVIWVGLLVFYLFNVPKSARFSNGLLFAAGGLAGLLIALVLVDLPRLWLGLHTLHGYLLRPPVLIWPWRPLDWLLQTILVMWQGQTFYFNRSLAPGWPISLQVWWVAIALLGGIAGMQARHDHGEFEFRRWFFAGLAVLISTIILVKAKEFLYGTNFLPFLVPIAASALAHPRTSSWRVWKYVSCALAGLSLLVFLNFCRVYAARTKPYEQIVKELRAILPSDHLKIVGPSVLWFVLDKEKFRDAGAIIFSRWYTGGRMDLKDWLGTWRPDILILDDIARNVILHSTQKNLRQSLGCPVKLLGVLDTEGAAYGRWEVYQIHWPEAVQ